MSRLVARLVYPALIAMVLTVIVQSLAIAAWSNTTQCGSSTYKICVSRDDDNVLPKNSTNGDDTTYSNNVYTGTLDSMNNSISSMQNWYSGRDVLFYTESDQQQNNFCVDSLYGYNSIGFGWDDNFESHLRYANDSRC
jgi:hypothetical protein